MCPADVKSKPHMMGHELTNGHSSNDTEELEDDDDSDSSSPPLPYLQTPAPDGCCTLDGIKRESFPKHAQGKYLLKLND